MSKANEPQTNVPTREVGPAEDFIEDVFGGLEFEFIQHFGQKWTPEINELFQASFSSCRAVATELDERATNKALAAHSVDHVRRLTNRSRRGS